MDCDTVTELLGNYIDEDLTAALRRMVDLHFAICASCRANLESLQDAVAKVRELADQEPPSPWFTERLLHRLAQASETSLTPIEQPAEDSQLGLW